MKFKILAPQGVDINLYMVLPKILAPQGVNLSQIVH